MTHSFISIARAAVVVQRFAALLAKSKVALALDMEGFRANPSPVSPMAMANATTANKRVVQQEMQFLLSGSKLWGKAGKKAPRAICRTSSVCGSRPMFSPPLKRASTD